ncbi:hypothetical protein [Allopusillimonas ginsengisoli]|uniref:hypothetical protein n=1 Tax=Allopusillimonas ginsengisoli TaxID=453575 RepID=UPI001ADC6A3A|nr:hypothetical protein [Allopusillimonas ginsengisoli]
MKRSALTVSILLTPLLLAACATRPAQPTAQASAPATPTGIYSTDDWLGQWDGPEATFLRLDGGGNDYLVTIRNLDGTRTFLGNRRAGTIQFERDGVLETIQHTDGKATGMKWLADKTDCLTVKQGEGYCRSGPPAPESKVPDAPAPDTPAPERIEPENDAPEAQAPASEAPFETRTFNETPADSAPAPETAFPEPQG